MPQLDLQSVLWLTLFFIGCVILRIRFVVGYLLWINLRYTAFADGAIFWMRWVGIALTVGILVLCWNVYGLTITFALCVVEVLFGLVIPLLLAVANVPQRGLSNKPQL